MYENNNSRANCFILICEMKTSYMKLIFIFEFSISHVKYVFRKQTLHVWNFQSVHFTCCLGISYVKKFLFYMWNENFMGGKCSNSICFSRVKFSKGPGENLRGECQKKYDHCLCYPKRSDGPSLLRLRPGYLFTRRLILVSTLVKVFSCFPVIRLAGSEKPDEGRVEIYHDGQWGTICDNGWDFDDADVACFELGFTGADKALMGDQVPNGVGRIWLENVDCYGTENNIKMCDNSGWGTSTCNHNKDAGVKCIPKGKVSRNWYTKSSYSCACHWFVRKMRMLRYQPPGQYAFYTL